jgi:hypothetical protein
MLIGAGLALRLTFAMLPFATLLTLLEDDAWMVTAIARHWALGHGITADGLNPTNGFHPLYPLTLGALPYLLNPNDLHFGFRASLIICSLLNALALIPFYAIARLVADRYVALAGLAVVALNPPLISVSVNAMETSLALLLLLTFWWYALARPPTTPRAAALLGLLAALAILARLDSMIAAGMLGLTLLWREVRARRFPALSLIYGTVAGLLLLPYFLRNLLEFGAISPSSGRALAYLHSYRESFAFSSGLQLIATQPVIELSWAPVWLWLLAIVALGFMIWRTPAPQRTLIVPLILYALALSFYYAYLQQQGLPRYYVGVGIVLALVLCAWASPRVQASERQPVARRWSLPVRWSPAIAALAIILMNGVVFARNTAQAQHSADLAQPAMFQAAQWIAANVPPEVRLASSNSGIFQYYSGHVVLNFDGKLNSEIIPVLARRQLDTYLRSKGIAYIVDLPSVAEYIEFYSRDLSEAKPHAEVSALQKLAIYGRLIGAKLGFGPAVQLDVRRPDRVVMPFSAVATSVRQFPLPNDPGQAVTLYRLNDEFGRP